MQTTKPKDETEIIRGLITEARKLNPDIYSHLRTEIIRINPVGKENLLQLLDSAFKFGYVAFNWLKILKGLGVFTS